MADKEGGYLIPEIAYRTKPGTRAVIWRWLGYILGSSEIYQKGRERWYPMREILERVKNLELKQ